eukprot:3676297-Prymnesium_polylepis.1
MAKKGMIGIALANSPEFVAAAAGGKACFGTNPIAFGIPQSGGPPLTFDMATSAIALFGVLTAKAKGEPLPDGVCRPRSNAIEPKQHGWCISARSPSPPRLSRCVRWRRAGRVQGGRLGLHVRPGGGARGWRDRDVWRPQGRGSLPVRRDARRRAVGRRGAGPVRVEEGGEELGAHAHRHRPGHARRRL